MRTSDRGMLLPAVSDTLCRPWGQGVWNGDIVLQACHVPTGGSLQGRSGAHTRWNGTWPKYFLPPWSICVILFICLVWMPESVAEQEAYPQCTREHLITVRLAIFSMTCILNRVQLLDTSTLFQVQYTHLPHTTAPWPSATNGPRATTNMDDACVVVLVCALCLYALTLIGGWGPAQSASTLFDYSGGAQVVQQCCTCTWGGLRIPAPHSALVRTSQ